MSKQYTQYNCYTILGINSNASPNEIKSARNNKSKTAHPDFGGSTDARIKVNIAYEVLSDPIQRQAHDFFC